MAINKKKQDDSYQRWEKILNAALDIFIEDSIEGARIEDICQLSGASVGSIYHYFGDKKGLAESVYLSALEKYLRPLYGAMQHEPCPREFISIIVQHHLDWVRDNRKAAIFLFPIMRGGRSKSLEEKVVMLNKKYLSRAFELLKIYAKRREIKALPRYLYAPLIMGPCQELVRQYLENRGEDISPAIGALMSDVIWQGLKN